MYEVPGLTLGFLAADVDMSQNVGSPTGYQFRAIWQGPSSNAWNYFGSALQDIGSKTSPPIGILQNNPIQGEPGTVMVHGVTKVWAYGNWAVDDPIGWDSSGRLIKALTTKFAIGTALMPGVAGQLSAIFLNIARGTQP